MAQHTIHDSSIATIRATAPVDRLRRAASMNRAAEMLAVAGLRRRLPHATPHERGVALALQRLGLPVPPLLPALFKELPVTDAPADMLIVAARAATACTEAGIQYLIGGGVAAAVHGEFRTTRDINLIVRLPVQQAARFTAALNAAFTVQLPTVRAALLRVPDAKQDRTQRATFMAYHTATGYRLAVACVSDAAYDTAQLQRAMPLTLTELPIALRIASAEDTVLTKLAWYRITPSDKQWEDVQTMFRVQHNALDTAYLATWARILRITNLLSRAERGERPPHHAVPEPQQRGRDSA